MNILKFESPQNAIEALAVHVIASAKDAIQQKGSFNLVLTGGSSPKVLYHLLSTTYKYAIDWTKVFFFIGDERYVPADHADYNGKMARETLLSPLNISEEQIFFVNTTLQQDQAAYDYYERIDAHFKGNITFDYTLLGMGADAHTASIFPGTDLCQEFRPTIAAVFVEKLDSWRISLSAALINKSQNISFLAFGKEKVEAFKSVQENPGSIEFPASLIEGNVSWYVDSAILGE